MSENSIVNKIKVHLNNSRVRLLYFLSGLSALTSGSFITLTSTPRFWQLTRTNFKYFALGLITILTTVYLTMFPLWLLSLAMAWLYEAPYPAYFDMCWDASHSAFVMFPAVVLFGIRWGLTQLSDELFFSVLDVQDKALTEELRKKPVQLWMIMVRTASRKLFKLGLLLLVCFGGFWIDLGVRVGVVGTSFLDFLLYVRILFQLWMSYSALGKEGLLFASIVTYLYGIDSCGRLVGYAITSIVLAKELLEPFKSRVRSEMLSMSQKFTEIQFLLLGFGVGCLLFLYVPYVGLLFWLVEQGSASTLLLMYFRLTNNK